MNIFEKISCALLVSGTIALSACSDDKPTPTPINPPTTDSTNTDSTKSMLSIELNNAPTLFSQSATTPNFIYVAWLDYNGKKIPVGRIELPNISNHVSKTLRSISVNLPVGKDTLSKSTAFSLSIESANIDFKTATISNAVLFSGSFTADSVKADINSSFGSNFTTMLGASAIASSFTVGTLTDTANANKKAGIWFVSGTAPNYAAGFQNLPTLPAGWTYQAWLVTNGFPFTIGGYKTDAELDAALPFSIGKFKSASGADDGNPYSSATPNPAAPLFPGEDFLINTSVIEPYKSVVFPYTPTKGRDLILVSIEPEQDDNPYAPFIRIFSHQVQNDITGIGSGSPIDGGTLLPILDEPTGHNPAPTVKVKR